MQPHRHVAPGLHLEAVQVDDVESATVQRAASRLKVRKRRSWRRVVLACRPGGEVVVLGTRPCSLRRDEQCVAPSLVRTRSDREVAAAAQRMHGLRIGKGARARAVEGEADALLARRREVDSVWHARSHRERPGVVEVDEGIDGRGDAAPR